MQLNKLSFSSLNNKFENENVNTHKSSENSSEISFQNGEEKDSQGSFDLESFDSFSFLTKSKANTRKASYDFPQPKMIQVSENQIHRKFIQPKRKPEQGTKSNFPELVKQLDQIFKDQILQKTSNYFKVNTISVSYFSPDSRKIVPEKNSNKIENANIKSRKAAAFGCIPLCFS